jgi:tetratricopeptide (TPR) repeat protein
VTDLSPVADDPARPLRELIAQGRFREALERHRSTADPAAERPDLQLLAATAATRLGELQLASTLAEGALQRFRARADHDGRMRALNLLGAIAFEHGQLENAERAFGGALELARELEDTLMSAHASNNLASVAHLRTQPETALTLYRSALTSFLRVGDRHGTARTYHNLALAFRSMAEWTDAESAALEAVRHAEQVGDPSLLALAMMGRAEIRIDRGELAVARQELERVARLLENAGDPIGEAELHRLRALCALHEGAFDGALLEADEGRRIAMTFDSAQLQAECAAVAARALRALHRPEASERRAEAFAIFQRLGATRLLEELDRDLPH